MKPRGRRGGIRGHSGEPRGTAETPRAARADTGGGDEAKAATEEAEDAGSKQAGEATGDSGDGHMRNA